MTTHPDPCGLNGCTNPIDPNSMIGRCADCTLAWSVEWMGLQDKERQRRAALTRRAPVDAILLAQAIYRDDTAAGQTIVNRIPVRHAAQLRRRYRGPSERVARSHPHRDWRTITMTDTIGAQRPDDPRGWLVFEHLPNDMQNAEDTTQAHDFTRRGHKLEREFDATRGHTVRFFTRPATATERALLTHLDYELPAELTTRVEYLTETLRQRRWPQLEREDTTP